MNKKFLLRTFFGHFWMGKFWCFHSSIFFYKLSNYVDRFNWKIRNEEDSCRFPLKIGERINKVSSSKWINNQKQSHYEVCKFDKFFFKIKNLKKKTFFYWIPGSKWFNWCWRWQLSIIEILLNKKKFKNIICLSN